MRLLSFRDARGRFWYGSGVKYATFSPGPFFIFCILVLGLLGIGAATQINLTTQVQGILPTANGGTGQNSTATFPTSGTVMTTGTSVVCSQEPALTGDVTSTAGSCGTTVGQIEGAAIPVSAPLVGTNSSKQLIAATEANLDSMGYAAGGGTAQAQTLTLSPAITSLTAGLYVCWMPAAANTGSGPTLAVNSLTAKTIIKVGGASLAASDLTTTAIACAVYDGTSFELQNPQTAININFQTDSPTCSSGTLSLTYTPLNLLFFENGQLLTKGSSNDYTISGSTITLVSGCPSSGTNLFTAFYNH